jgi:hypothetical protein
MNIEEQTYNAPYETVVIRRRGQARDLILIASFKKTSCTHPRNTAKRSEN